MNEEVNKEVDEVVPEEVNEVVVSEEVTEQVNEDVLEDLIHSTEVILQLFQPLIPAVVRVYEVKTHHVDMKS